MGSKPKQAKLRDVAPGTPPVACPYPSWRVWVDPNNDVRQRSATGDGTVWPVALGENLLTVWQRSPFAGMPLAALLRRVREQGNAVSIRTERRAWSDRLWHIRVWALPAPNDESDVLVGVDTSPGESIPETDAGAAARFARSLAHEIGNPLAGISNTLQLLRARLEDSLQARIDQSLRDVVRIERATRVVHLFARHTVVHRQPLALRDVVRHALRHANIPDAHVEISGEAVAFADAEVSTICLTHLLEWFATIHPSSSHALLSGQHVLLCRSATMPHAFGVECTSDKRVESGTWGLGISLAVYMLERMGASVAFGPDDDIWVRILFPAVPARYQQDDTRG